MRRRFSIVVAAMFLSAVFPRAARSENLNVFAGSNIRSHEYGLVAAELTFPMIAEVGPFFDWSRSTINGPENRYIAGLVGRITTPWLNFFVDTRAGCLWGKENPGFSLELGLGYRFVGDTVDLMPRFGINAVDVGGDLPVTNLSLGMSMVL